MKENRTMKNAIITLSVAIVALLAWVVALLIPSSPETPAPADAVVAVEPAAAPEPSSEPATAPVKAEPAPTKWEHLGPDAWPALLPGKWEGESDKHVMAEFVHEREDSKTPWNVKLSAPNDENGLDYFGCGFYESGESYCRRTDDLESGLTKITIKSKAGTNAIEVIVFDGEFAFKLVKVAAPGE